MHSQSVAIFKMTKTICIILLLFSEKIFSQNTQYWERSDIEFPYFDFVDGNCPCKTENMTNETLHESQLKAYREAQVKADLLTKMESPCYVYRAKFICGVLYPTKIFYLSELYLCSRSTFHSPPYDPARVDVEIIFGKPLDRDSTICPAWQIVIERKKVLLKLMRQDYSSGTTFCDYDNKR